jgi:hypothetical protein
MDFWMKAVGSGRILLVAAWRRLSKASGAAVSNKRVEPLTALRHQRDFFALRS